MPLVDLDDGPQLKQETFRTALVIEEAGIFSSGIVRFLRKEGWMVHAVRRAQQALPLLVYIPYQLIVIDYQMPGLNGIDFARLLHRSRGWRRTPLVVITNSLTAALASQAEESGALLARRSTWAEDLSSILARLPD